MALQASRCIYKSSIHETQITMIFKVPNNLANVSYGTIIEEACARANFKVVHYYEHLFDADASAGRVEGITAVAILAESSVVLHTYYEAGVISVNVCYCSGTPAYNVVSCFTSQFESYGFTPVADINNTVTRTRLGARSNG